MSKVIRYISLYWQFIVVYMKSKMQYRIGFFAEILANFVLVGVYYAGIVIIFTNFKEINGWNLSQILFLFSFNWLCYSVSGFLLWAPMLNLGDTIQAGEFDSYLIRPLNPLTYLVFRQFQYTFIPRLIVALVFIVSSFKSTGIEITVQTVSLMVIYLITGILIHSCILVCIGAVSFVIIQNRQVGELLTSSDYGLRTFTDYPLSIYNKFVRFLLTCLIPYAFVNYYPVAMLLGKNKEISTNSMFYVLPVLIAVILFIIAKIAWNAGLRKYESTGN